jgi:hypothetical protein
MRKLIGSLVIAIIAGALGIGAWIFFKDKGPRERVDAQNGSKVIVEELSYYSHGKKLFGKVFKPTDENGNFPDSLGKRPAIIFFHEPLYTSLPQSVLTSLASHGIVGYMAALHDDKDAQTLLDKIRNEKFVEKDQVFFVADSASAKAAIGAAAKNKKKVAGLVLIRPSEELTSSKNMHKYGKEACIVKSNENSQILEYLESLGALK